MSDDEAAIVADVVHRHAPEAAVRIEFAGDVATVLTDQPGLVIGRRGATATAIRDELTDRLGRRVQLRVIEVGDDGDGGGSGVREPRPRPPMPPDDMIERYLAEFPWDDVVDSIDDRDPLA